jgi:hypothetical protein
VPQRLHLAGASALLLGAALTLPVGCGTPAGPGTLVVQTDGPCIGGAVPSFTFEIKVFRGGRLLDTVTMPQHSSHRFPLQSGSYTLHVRSGYPTVPAGAKAQIDHVSVRRGRTTVRHVPDVCVRGYPAG